MIARLLCRLGLHAWTSTVPFGVRACKRPGCPAKRKEAWWR